MSRESAARRKWPESMCLVCALLLSSLGACAENTDAKDPYAAQRERMVKKDIAGRGFGRTAVKDRAVLRVMGTVPRHKFVPTDLVDQAYDDRPLPIGHGQTISQPYIVAFMTEALRVNADDVVLEVGTGSGYQAAVLAELVKRVYTIEIIDPLAKHARKTLEQAGCKNVEVQTGDGYFGWEEKAPFDGIIVTAAASHIPPPLIEQLKPGARMVIPVGPPFQVQNLMIVEKQKDGSTVQRNVMPVSFVPLTRASEDKTPTE
jgi:protein-L-isoaspartate(D-aspartate) O-methyltransferase